MPRRAHKSWQYARPIRRYDHYCALGGNQLGIAVDIYLAVLIAEKGFLASEIIVASIPQSRDERVVLTLSGFLASEIIVAPILKIHVGLISRNEMAQEWKKNEHYVANNTTIGDKIPVEELDDDEQLQHVDLV
eukprot:s528_g12.t1